MDDFLRVVVHTAIVMVATARLDMAAQKRWMYLIIPILTTLFAWEWLPHIPSGEVPDWVMVETIFLCTSATALLYIGTRRGISDRRIHLGLVLFGGVAAFLPASLVAYITWGIVT